MFVDRTKVESESLGLEKKEIKEQLPFCFFC